MLFGTATFPVAAFAVSATATPIHVSVDSKDGSYTLGVDGSAPIIHAHPAVRVNGKWVSSTDYPRREVQEHSCNGELGDCTEWTVTFAGIAHAPNLILHIRAYSKQPFGDLQLSAHNTDHDPVQIQAFRLLDASGPESIHLPGDASANRVLSDSFSEDRPAMQLHDWKEAEKQVHRAVGVQLVYNRESRKSWFLGALTSDKFLTVMRLHMAGKHSAETHDYEVDSTGTTELLTENSLLDSAAPDRVELSLPLGAASDLSSERLLFSISDDYHNQLETYAHLVRDIHHARVSAPTPLGWWSWTAFYFGLSEGAALTNAQWLAQHLKTYGYSFVHMDEGYQYARGEYATPNATLFPNGIASLEHKVVAQGLTPGIWTAPFEVSERSWVFAQHPEWLVHNASGQPIHIGAVVDGKDQLYALDPTHPGAQQYLTMTYRTLAHSWGIRYIKMDFMEDSAVEGTHYEPHVTALEAQRIGIKVIRAAVGESVLLDKDGGELLNPVGLVDTGRISQDTGHTFSSSKDAAPGVAARYYMNRNYFIADADAFSVSKQTVTDQNWHGGESPLTLDEAKVSIALSAVSGGMFEIGDDLPTLGEDADRVALVENRDLIEMAQAGRASIPLDLMTYAAEDLQPSIFLVHENNRQSMLTVFNWTEKLQTHTLTRNELGLAPYGSYRTIEVLTPGSRPAALSSSLVIRQPAHSVRMFKIIAASVAPRAPELTVSVPTTGRPEDTLEFHAHLSSSTPAEPLLGVTWEFGDGISLDGETVEHSYTHAGTYTIRVHGRGLDGRASEQRRTVTISGALSTNFSPEKNRRFIQDHPGRMSTTPGLAPASQ